MMAAKLKIYGILEHQRTTNKICNTFLSMQKGKLCVQFLIWYNGDGAETGAGFGIGPVSEPHVHRIHELSAYEIVSKASLGNF
jgi:hypothetical protein